MCVCVEDGGCSSWKSWEPTECGTPPGFSCIKILPNFLSLIITDLLPSSWHIFQSAFHSDKYTLSTRKDYNGLAPS